MADTNADKPTMTAAAPNVELSSSHTSSPALPPTDTPPADEKREDMKQHNNEVNADDGVLSVHSGLDLVNVQLDQAKEKKLLTKLDFYFVPIIMFAYLTCFLDRGNIGLSLPFSPGVNEQQYA